MTNTSNTFGGLALQLHARGYPVLPLDGKAPKIPKWSELSITEQLVAQWAAEKSRANIGLRCDQALMVDLDIEDGDEAQRMTERILDKLPGGLIRRRGDNAKLALLYRRADPDGAYKDQGQKRYCHASGGVVELFDNSGAQMGIFSSGLDGGDYRWDGPSPLDVPFNELTPLTLKQWGALRQLLTQEGYVTPTSHRTKQTAQTPKADGPTEPDLSADWNNGVFAMIGKQVRAGVDDATLEAEALRWRLPGYSEQETLAEVRDMITRWRRFVADEPWEGQLQLGPKGMPRATMKNLLLTLRNADELRDSFRLNSLVQEVELAKPLPWRSDLGQIDTNDFTHLRAFFNDLGMTPTKQDTMDAVYADASEKAFNPIQGYLTALTWDGTARFETRLPELLSIEPSAYVTAVLRCWMISAVARAMKPGSKVDTMLILEGKQGVGKSTALATLASRPWFLDNLADIGSGKAAEEQQRGKWIVEVAELDAMNKAEATRVKAFLTREKDNWRPLYQSANKDHPRSCVFAGSTNEDRYLRDATGARRFWPVKVQSMVDIAGLGAERDQLFAEALHLYKQGAKWWLTAAEQSLACDEQERRRERDPWEELVEEFVFHETTFDGKVRISQRDLYAKLEIQPERQNRLTMQRLDKVMATLPGDWRRLPTRQKIVCRDGRRVDVFVWEPHDPAVRAQLEKCKSANNNGQRYV